MLKNKQPSRILLLTLILVVALPVLVLGGNDFVSVELSTDDSSVTTGQYLDYRHFIYANDASDISDFTTGWFSVDLDEFDGSTYSAQFTQVGILTRSSQAQWFVYSEATVQCLRGHYAWPVWAPYIWLGCTGDFGDLGITPGNLAWTRVEAVTYSGQNWWILRVYDVNGVAHDVAKVFNGSKQIYRANAASEEGYGGATDPHALMDLYHYHPEYWKPGVGFRLWPEYDGVGETNHLGTYPAGICPGWYGAEVNVQGNSHLWRTVSGGLTCYRDPLF